MIRSDRAGAIERPRTCPHLSLVLAGLFVLGGCSGEIGPGADSVDGVRNIELVGGQALMPDMATAGAVEVTLHPGTKAEVGAPAVVSFGAPFPPGVLSDATRVRALDADGAELPVHSEAILPWRVFPGSPSGQESVRAAMISVEVSLEKDTPRTITLEYGVDPGKALARPEDPRAGWVPVTDGEFPGGAVREPRVYATFPSDWLSGCLLRTRTEPLGTDPAFDWFEESLMGSAHTAVNDVPAAVTQRIDVTGDNEPWLFDRTATLFGVYVRTGDVKWLRHAHRSAQFYRSRITPEGYFDLKDGDLKYSYGRSLLMDFILTGDPELLDTIERIAAAGATWKPEYKETTNFWTERHQTYALLAALAAWEATGAEEHALRVREVVDVSFQMAADPAGNWNADGCMLHGMTAHEGAGGNVPVCSPWMSALFADAIWEYFVHTSDRAALEFLDGLGQYVVDYALYEGEAKLPYTMPWYLASSVKTFSDEGAWGDVEHTCDVAGLLAKAAFARQQLGGDPAELHTRAVDLLPGCQWVLDNWHRPGGLEFGQSEWRLSPARKFNWWFGTTSDLSWLINQTAE